MSRWRVSAPMDQPPSPVFRIPARWESAFRLMSALRPIDPLPHQERQRRPARNDPGGISVMPEGLDRLLDRRGRDDLKGLHDADPSEARRAPNTLAGVTGRSLTRTPMASKIAFATAGAVGTRTGSPIPFAL